ncbi:hypothetical protein [Rhizobium sp. S163]|uniref:hypothetical protein n=1 Tax=Rhizobium sp. S163 TaxID=3055039 RepID=UPI0025A9E3BC|nr:hypothetical protein [Rhizobium sp. S163]MDM9645603.1 hypothetical protein [Rhizobium sp. S163]
MSLAFLDAARADITLRTVPMDGSPPVIVLKGEFTQRDDPNPLAKEIATSGARTVTFDSNGGNVAKAMEYGRLIRSLGLSTLRLRAAQCASACTLAFSRATICVTSPRARCRTTSLNGRDSAWAVYQTFRRERRLMDADRTRFRLSNDAADNLRVKR